MTEKQFENKIRKFLNSLEDQWHFKTHGGGMQISGLPDLIGCYKGRFFGLEVKKKGGKESKLQQAVIKLLCDSGAYARFVYPDDFEELKKDFIKGLTK